MSGAAAPVVETLAVASADNRYEPLVSEYWNKRLTQRQVGSS